MPLRSRLPTCSTGPYAGALGLICNRRNFGIHYLLLLEQKCASSLSRVFSVGHVYTAKTRHSNDAKLSTESMQIIDNDIKIYLNKLVIEQIIKQYINCLFSSCFLSYCFLKKRFGQKFSKVSEKISDLVKNL